MSLAGIRASKAIAVVSLCAAIAAVIVVGAGAAQFPPSPVLPANPVPPQLRNLTLTNRSVIVAVAQLDNGQTVSQVFAPSPAPSAGRLMVVSGTWPVAVYGGGEGQLNRKIRAVLTSPFGQTVADGCGYSSDVTSTYTPKLLTTGQFSPGASDATGQWRVSLQYCDGYGNGDGVSRSLGQIRIAVAYNAP
jgi:hypothetical protein